MKRPLVREVDAANFSDVLEVLDAIRAAQLDDRITYIYDHGQQIAAIVPARLAEIMERTRQFLAQSGAT